MIYSGDGNFIYACFANKDRGVAVPIIENMQRLGFRVWFEFGAIDKFDYSKFVFSGSEWYAHGGHLDMDYTYNVDPCPEMLAKCRCFVVFITRNSAAAENVKRDVARAINFGKDILAVYVEPCELDHALILQLGIVQSLYLERFYNLSDFYAELRRSVVLRTCLGEPMGYFPSILSPRKNKVDGTLCVGEEVCFGSYPQDGKTPAPLEWLVIFRSSSFITLLSKYIIDFRPFHWHSAKVLYDKSSLRRWLNGQFYNSAFTKEEKLLIDEETVAQIGNDFDSPWSDGETVQDKVYLFDKLSINRNAPAMESDYLLTDETRRCMATPNAIRGLKIPKIDVSYPWWILTPGIYPGFTAFVKDTGEADMGGTFVNDATIGVRPAIHLYLDDID